MAIYQNKPIKSLSGEVFSLGDGDFAILYNFAIKGETTRHQIITTQDKKTVSRKIDILFKKGFLNLRKSTPFRNQPHKTTKFFGLSLKGFLASLHYCNIEDNYLTKKYLKGIKNKELSKAILNYLKDYLLHFFTYNSIRGLTLDNMNNISSWVENYDSLSGFSEDEEKHLNMLRDDRYKSWDVFDKLLPDKSALRTYVDNWYHYMDDYTEGLSYDEIMKDIGEPMSHDELMQYFSDKVEAFVKSKYD